MVVCTERMVTYTSCYFLNVQGNLFAEEVGYLSQIEDVPRAVAHTLG